MFAVAINNTKTPTYVTMYVNHTSSFVQSINMNQAYVNILDQGVYQYYQLLPSANPNMLFLTSL
jgi:hypothetical protein